MIRHTVVFNLKHADGSAESLKFLQDAMALAEIPSVRNFERLKQVSPKNDYSYGLSMEFDDEAGYKAYDIDPRHQAFVQERWIPEVSKFMEIDYVKMP